MKKILLLFTVLFTISIVNAQTFTDGDYTFEVTDVPTNQVSISGTTATGDVTFPTEALDGFAPYDVTGVKGALIDFGAGITSIIIPAGYKTFEGGCFRGMSDLVSITFNDGEVFGDKMFRSLGALDTVFLPNTITSWGVEMFSESISLANITLGNCPTINSKMFRNTSVTNLTLPATLTTIAAGGWNLSSVTTLVVEGSTPPVIDAAWEGTAANITAYVPSADLATYQAAAIWMDMTLIGGAPPTVFVGDTFTIDDLTYKITSIDDLEVEVFDRATAETAITVPATATNPGDATYNVVQLGASVFLGDDIVSVDLASSVVTIDKRAFQDCASLTTINLENVVTVKWKDAFLNCANLAAVDLSSTTFIGDGSFNGCTSLTTITIPSAVTEIGTDAFNGCTGLTDVTVEHDPTPLVVGTPFGTLDVSAINLHVPNGTYSAYDAAVVWTDFIIVEGALSVQSIEALNVSVYPNPTNDVVFVKTKQHKAVDLTVFDLNGRSLLSVKGNQVDMTNLSQGIYILKGKTERGTFAQRIVKK